MHPPIVNHLNKKCKYRVVVSVDGIGPSTSVLSGQRSTTELHAQTTSNYWSPKIYQKIDIYANTKNPNKMLGFFGNNQYGVLVFSATTTEVATSTWWASFHRASDVYGELSSFEILVVEHRDSFLSFLFC